MSYPIDCIFKELVEKHMGNVLKIRTQPVNLILSRFSSKTFKV